MNFTELLDEISVANVSEISFESSEEAHHTMEEDHQTNKRQSSLAIMDDDKIEKGNLQNCITRKSSEVSSTKLTDVPLMPQISDELPLSSKHVSPQIEDQIIAQLMLERPKKPMTAFFIYKKTEWGVFKKKFPDARVSELTAKMSEAWKKLDHSKKAVFEQQYESKLKEYQEALREYTQRLADFEKDHPEIRIEKKTKRKKDQQSLPKSKKAKQTKKN